MIPESRFRLASSALKGAVFSTCYFLSSAALVFAQTTLPSVELFQNPNPNLSFTEVANRIAGIANSVIPFLIGLAIALVVWGIFRYVAAAGDSEVIAEAKKGIIWGIIAIFMMLAFWGLVITIHNSIFG